MVQGGPSFKKGDLTKEKVIFEQGHLGPLTDPPPSFHSSLKFSGFGQYRPCSTLTMTTMATRGEDLLQGILLTALGLVFSGVFSGGFRGFL